MSGLRFTALFVILICINPVYALSADLSGKSSFLIAARNGRAEARNPILSVSPKEIDLGALKPGMDVSGVYNLKNLGSGSLTWTLMKPAGWYCSDEQKISGVLDNKGNHLKVNIKYIKGGQEAGADKTKNSHPKIVLKFEFDNKVMTCKKELLTGSYREVAKLISGSASRNIFVKFRVLPAEAEPLLDINTMRIDFGSVVAGEQITKKIELTNKGRDILKWNVDFQPAVKAVAGKKGRYVSFQNESVKGTGRYTLSPQTRDKLEIFGLWVEEGGYPVAAAPNSTLKYHFYGRGLAVMFWRNPDGGNLSVYIDDRFISRYECRSEQREEAEFIIADNLADGPHTLTLISKEGRIAIEGARILARDVARGGSGWLKVFPMSGRIHRETDYVNVMVDTQRLAPGWYGDYVVFASTGGNKVVEVSVEVSSASLPRVLDVYRYVRGYDYFFTTNPQAEAKSIQAGNYQKQGIAFRLFSPGVPGTTSFHRWYNMQKGDRFYSYDPRGGGKSLQGYYYEGVIGNIATSRLSNTRALYRWYNSSRSNYFFTTDTRGEGMTRRGYRFDGIAGYVR